MQLFSLNRISPMGLFRRCKAAKINNFFLKGYLRLVWIFLKPMLKADPFKAIFIGIRTIGSILTICGLSKIFNSIISFISINMVYLVGRPKFSFIKPSKPMGGIMLPVNFNIDIPPVMHTSSLHPYSYFRSRLFPIKHAGAFIVRKNAN